MLKYLNDGIYRINVAGLSEEEIDNKISEITNFIRNRNLENFLIDNNFEIDSYLGTNERYRKQITKYHFLYVTILSNINKIFGVEYETLGMTQHEDDKIVSLETIETLEQLELLVKALEVKNNKL